MAESFLGSMLSGGARKPVDMNDPTWTSPESIKQRQTLADQLTGRATQPFAPHWAGALAAGLTGVHGGLERISADQALKANTAMEVKSAQAAADAKDNISAGRALAAGGVPSLGMKGVEHIIAERNDTEKKAIEKQKADAAMLTAQAHMAAVPKTAVNTLTGEIYDTRTGIPVGGGGAPGQAPSVRDLDQGSSLGAHNPVVLNQWRKEEAPKILTASSKAQDEQTGVIRSIDDMAVLAKYADTGWGAEGLTTLRKMAARAGVEVSDKIAPTELFRALTQQFVLKEGQKLKPMSNSDVTFVQQGLATITSDSRTLPVMLPALKRAAEREVLTNLLRERWITQRGTPPSEREIAAYVDQKFPSVIKPLFENRDTTQVPTGQKGVTATPPSGPTVPGKSQARLGQPQVQGRDAIPADAIRELTNNPTPARVKQFEDVFGKGSAAQFLTVR